MAQAALFFMPVKAAPNPNKTLPPSPRPLLVPNFLKRRSSSSSSAVNLRRVGGPVMAVKAFATCSSLDSVAAAALERCFAASTTSNRHMDIGASGVVMKDNGTFQAATLERSKLDTTRKPSQSASTPELSMGGNGGDIGNGGGGVGGGGGGGNNGGDDDDYFDDFDDGEDGDEGGLFRRRMFLLAELFAREFLDCVLSEWYKTSTDLPAWLRLLYEMGLVSSAQLTRFAATNARSTIERCASRLLPEGVCQAFHGRMMADPSFFHKLALELTTTLFCSAWWEVKNRKHRWKQEWDLVLLHALTISACNAIVFWSLTPCCLNGSTFPKLPNNIFEKSYPLREFDMQKRIQSFIYKAAGLFTVGLVSGAVQGSMSKVLASRKKGRSSVTIPSVGTNALRYGAFLGLFANLRCQILCGTDMLFKNHFDVIVVAQFFSLAMR